MFLSLEFHLTFLWVSRLRSAQVDDTKEEEGENPLLVPLEEKAVLQEEQANLWFSKVGPGRLTGHMGIPWNARRAAEVFSPRMASVELRMMLTRPWRSVRLSCCTRLVGRSHPYNLLV